MQFDQPGASWQDAELDAAGTSWKMYYGLPTFGAGNEASVNPTGQYSFSIRAYDRAGNVFTSAPVQIKIDQTAPATTLITPADIAARTAINEPITIGGAVNEQGTVQTGIASAEIAFTPESVVSALGAPALLLPLDDPLGATSFRDDASARHDGSCTACPVPGAPGRFGDAAQFDNAESQSIKVASIGTLTSTVTLSQWFKTTCGDCGLSSVESLQGATQVIDQQVYLSGGNLCADVVNGSRESICSADANYADGEWHQVAHVLGGGLHQLYVDGALAATGAKGSSSFGVAGKLSFGYAPAAAQDYFSGALDQVQMFAQALSAQQVRGLFQSWAPVVLASSGNGVNSTTWSATVPRNLEGNYQIDLTASDVLGNRNDKRDTWKHWLGEIDTSPPRVGISYNSYYAAGVAYTEINAWAEDLNLTTDGLVFPCSLAASGVNNTLTSLPRSAPGTLSKSFNTLTPRGDTRQRLNRINLSCKIKDLFYLPGSVEGAQAGVTILACDIFGRCASQVPSRPSAMYIGRSDVIQKTALPNGNPQTLVPESVAGNLALDSGRSFLYWANAGAIRRSNTDGTNVVTLISGLTSPRDPHDRPGRRQDLLGGKRPHRPREPGRLKRRGGRAGRRQRDRDRLGARQALLEHRQQDLYGQPDGSGASQITFNCPAWNNCKPIEAITALAVHPDTGQVYFIDQSTAPRTPPVPPAADRMRVRIMTPDGSNIGMMVTADGWSTGLLGIDRVTGEVYYGVEQNNYLSPNTLLLKRFSSWYGGSTVLQFNGNTPRGIAIDSSAASTLTEPDLTLTQTASRTTIAPSDPLTFTLTIQNVGPSVARSVVLTDTLPTGVTFVSATSSRGDSCPAPIGGTLTCALGDFPFGTTVAVNVRVVVDAGFLGQLTNRAGVSFADPDGTPGGNFSSLTIGVNPATPTITPTATRPPATATPTAANKRFYWTNGNVDRGDRGRWQRSTNDPYYDRLAHDRHRDRRHRQAHLLGRAEPECDPQREF